MKEQRTQKNQKRKKYLFGQENFSTNIIPKKIRKFTDNKNKTLL